MTTSFRAACVFFLAVVLVVLGRLGATDAAPDEEGKLEKAEFEGAVAVKKGIGALGECDLLFYREDPNTAPSMDAEATIRLEKSGEFKVSLLPKQQYRVIVRGYKYERVEQGFSAIIETPESSGRLNINVGLGSASISGMAIDDTGAPVNGVKLSLRGPNNYMGKTAPDEPSTEVGIETDETGKYRFRHLGPGWYSLFPERYPGPEDGVELYLADYPAMIEVSESETPVEKMDIVFTRSTVCVRGIVVDEDNKPMAGVEVCAIREQPTPEATTDDTGRFSFKVPAYAEKAATIFFKAEGYIGPAYVLDNMATPRERRIVLLAANKACSLQVSIPDGLASVDVPSKDMLMLVLPPLVVPVATFFEVVRLENGNLEIRGMYPGEYFIAANPGLRVKQQAPEGLGPRVSDKERIEAWLLARPEAVHAVTLRAGETKNISLSPHHEEQPRHVYGKLLTASREPTASMYFGLAFREDRSVVCMVLPYVDREGRMSRGRFVMPNAEPGKYTMMVIRNYPYKLVHGEITVGAEDSEPIIVSDWLY